MILQFNKWLRESFIYIQLKSFINDSLIMSFNPWSNLRHRFYWFIDSVIHWFLSQTHSRRDALDNLQTIHSYSIHLTVFQSDSLTDRITDTEPLITISESPNHWTEESTESVTEKALNKLVLFKSVKDYKDTNKSLINDSLTEVSETMNQGIIFCQMSKRSLLAARLALPTCTQINHTSRVTRREDNVVNFCFSMLHSAHYTVWTRPWLPSECGTDLSSY